MAIYGPKPVTALLIGGPRDGDLLTVQNGEDVIAVAMPPAPGYYAYAGVQRREEEFSFHTRHYRRERIHLFGRVLNVWVFETVRPHERDELVAKHLLSPVALGLLGGQR